ncbi:error-prone DNA polymerase [Chitinophaga lutea]
MRYTELQVTTNFSFLRGASHPDELAEKAAELGYTALAVTDCNTMAGIVRAHAAVKDADLRLIPACRLDLLDGPSLLAYPTDKDAYARLCTLLTKGNLRAEKGDCHLYRQDVYEHARDIIFLSVPPAALNASFDFEPEYIQALAEYREAFGRQLYLSAVRSYQGDDMKKLHCLSQLSSRYRIPLVATNDVHYHEPARRELQDILTCVREKCTIHTAGFRLHQNAERYLKPVEEMERLFRQYPDAVRRTLEITEACQFSLNELKYVYPEELTTNGRTPQEELEMLTMEGAHERFGDVIPKKAMENISKELKFIARKEYAPYFLTVHDIVRYAQSQRILCQGRGSAANSTVCYCLGITSVNPEKFDLLFERFLSDARNEPPDIDVDFEHERREEVIQYIYQKYGRDRAAIIATVTQLHRKGAVRDVGKAMGLSADMITRLSESMWDFYDGWFDVKRLKEHGLNPHDPLIRKVVQLTGQMLGFPRQLGQHTGGFVMTQGKLTELCPVLNARMEDRTCIEWNKDDVDALGFMKVDVLALGMLTCIRKAFDLVSEHYNRELTLANVPEDDKKVYEMISRADTIGVFQIESRAQMSMLPRLKPEKFYDLVIEVAIVRPGPIQGDMVHPYLRRRNKEEEPEYPKEELKQILKKTLGIPLFQEQAMQVAITAADFTPTEADELRRAMATFKAKGVISKFHDKLINGMVAKGYEQDFAERIFKQLEGFGSYGFPESHAVSFALLAYVSSWLKYHYPDVFACALLNSMPMGFYQPAQIVIDAQKHGVEVRPVDINYSRWDNTLEEPSGSYRALRLGFRQVSGLNAEEANKLMAAKQGRFTGIADIKGTGVLLRTMELLADADAFRSIGLDRRQALWEVTALNDQPQGMYTGQSAAQSNEAQIELPGMSQSEHVVEDYNAVGLSLKAHPVHFVREKLSLLHITPSCNLNEIADGETVKVAGLVLVRQRPGTASGVCFITLEDEYGIVNLVLFQKIFDKYRKDILQAKLLMVEGKLQREGEVVHVVVSKCHNLNKLLQNLVVPTSRADERDGEFHSAPKPDTVAAEVFYGGRNFH